MAFTVAIGSGMAIIPCGNTTTAIPYTRGGGGHRTRRKLHLHVAGAKKPLNGDDVSVYTELLKTEVSVIENKPLDDNDAALKFVEKIDRQFQSPDFWEGPQWDWLGIFIKFSPIIGVAVAAGLAIYGCFTFHEPPKEVREAAERLYSVQSGVESNAESDLESSADSSVESGKVIEEPDAYDSDVFDSNPTEYFCMVMRINIDCSGCYRKVKRALLDMPELDTHLLEKNQTRVVVCGRFIPQDVAIKIKKKTNRRVEILDIQDLSESNAEMEDQKPMTNNWTLLTTQNQMETCLA